MNVITESTIEVRKSIICSNTQKSIICQQLTNKKINLIKWIKLSKSIYLSIKKLIVNISFKRLKF